MKTVLSILVAFMTSLGLQALAQNNGIIYDGSLENGWQNFSSATVNLANTSPVYSGSESIAVTSGPFQALYFHAAAPFDSTPYTSLRFWINGGATGGQTLNVVALIGSSDVAQPAVPIGPIAAGVWQQITLPLSSLGVADQTNTDGFWLQENAGITQPTFYVDDVSLVSVPELGQTPLIYFNRLNETQPHKEKIYGYTMISPDATRCIQFLGQGDSQNFYARTNTLLPAWEATKGITFSGLICSNTNRIANTAYVTGRWGFFTNSGVAWGGSKSLSWLSHNNNNVGHEDMSGILVLDLSDMLTVGKTNVDAAAEFLYTTLTNGHFQQIYDPY